ncbi:MAG: hypothetical protein HZC38_17625 [Chloroflexi bacterium]|nr:hypothetical protein [Chloroflexota bacterium]MBI5715221.1 hypothetical protein [Chloroflexota bacterium]
MSKLRRKSRRFAICLQNKEYPASLELHKLYRVLPDADAAKDGDLRVIDESGYAKICCGVIYVRRIG